MQKLVRLSALLLFVFALGAYVTPSASAQEKSAGSKTTVTGCLQKGDEAGEYSITGEDGKIYGLRSKTVKLSQHLGHKVMITGTLSSPRRNCRKLVGDDEFGGRERMLHAARL